MKPAPIILYEHEKTVVQLDQSVAKGLAEHKKANVSVTPSSDGWILKPSQIIGVVTIGAQQFIIKPKIRMSNVLALLEVTPRSLEWSTEQFEYDKSPDLLIALVRLFLRTLDTSLAHGPCRDYRSEEERLMSIRGRIDFTKIVGRAGLAIPVPCEFDEYTPDIPINRALRAAIEHSLLISGVPQGDRDRLRRHLASFEGVRSDIGSTDWFSHWTPNRMNQHFAPAVRLAALLCQRHSLADRTGTTSAGTFLVDMNKLVEKFIEVRLQATLRTRLIVNGQERLWLDEDRRVRVKPDLVFEEDGDVKFVADVKYKIIEEVSGSDTSDLFQLHTYAEILGLKSGALITCTTSDENLKRTDVITVRHSGVKLHVWPIDLRQDIDEITKEIDRLAELVALTSPEVVSLGGSAK